MNDLLEWLAKFFGHIPVAGTEAFLLNSLKAALILLTVYGALQMLFKFVDRHFKNSAEEDKHHIRA